MSWEARAYPWLQTALLVGLCYFAADLTAAQIETRLQAGGRAAAATVPSLTHSNVPMNGLANAGELQFVLNNTAPAVPLNSTTTLVNGTPVATPTNATAAPPAPLPKLTGTLAGSGHSLAVLQSGGDTRVVAVNEEVNGYILTEVGQYSAVLKDKAGQTYNLSMDLAQNNTTGGVAPGNLFPSRPGQVPVAANATRAPMPAVTPAADGSISRGELQEMLNDYSKFIGHIQIKPIAKDGEPVGMQLNYNSPDNPFAKLGVNSGDVVTSMNNHPLKGPDDLMWIYQELRNATTLNFNIDRNGQKTSMSVHLRE